MLLKARAEARFRNAWCQLTRLRSGQPLFDSFVQLRFGWLP